MSKELTIHGEALGASQQGTLAAEQFLKDNYLFRFNELSGKVEYVTLPASEKPEWRVLTQKALNSIIIHAKREEISESQDRHRGAVAVGRGRGIQPYSALPEELA